MDIEAVSTVPVAELVDLYGSVEWGAYTSDPDGLALAIDNSAYVVTARDGGRLIGLARCVSDDVSISYLQDILVRPEWQRRGVGRALLEECLRRYSHVRLKMLLTDDEERQHAFYRALGYREVSEFDGGELHAFVIIEGP